MDPTRIAERAREDQGRGRGVWSPRTTLAATWSSIATGLGVIACRLRRW
jgi:hypothetical protein